MIYVDLGNEASHRRAGDRVPLYTLTTTAPTTGCWAGYPPPPPFPPRDRGPGTGYPSGVQGGVELQNTKNFDFQKKKTDIEKKKMLTEYFSSNYYMGYDSFR